eukprot:TRINITY_DN5581_c0_g1_i4.p2 TRINITY_DN5581_c0_g1~~TRINITY_DN5581_c0_g1_i4.p2  ORF type:complete len:114 (-),score=26.60 TRINITY_DN5581_c0_g1_i4:606-947(-)
MKRFGYRRFYPAPRTPEHWRDLWEKHKQLVPNVKKLSLLYSRKGPGQAGIRKFKAYNVPPLKHWNQDLDVNIDLSLEEREPKLIVELVNGTEAVVSTQSTGELKKILLEWHTV